VAVVIPGVSFHAFEDGEDATLWRESLTEAVAEVCSIPEHNITLKHSKDASPEVLELDQISRQLLTVDNINKEDKIDNIHPNIANINTAVRLSIGVTITAHTGAAATKALHKLMAAEGDTGPEGLSAVLRKYAALHHLQFESIGDTKTVIPEEGSSEAEEPAGKPAEEATPTPAPKVVTPTAVPTVAAPSPSPKPNTVNEGDLEDVIKHGTEQHATPAPTPSKVPLPPQGDGVAPTPAPATPAPTSLENIVKPVQSGTAASATVSTHINSGSITKPIAQGAGFVPWKGSDILGRGQKPVLPATTQPAQSLPQGLETGEQQASSQVDHWSRPVDQPDDVVPEVVEGKWIGMLP